MLKTLKTKAKYLLIFALFVAGAVGTLVIARYRNERNLNSSATAILPEPTPASEITLTATPTLGKILKTVAKTATATPTPNNHAVGGQESASPTPTQTQATPTATLTPAPTATLIPTITPTQTPTNVPNVKRTVQLSQPGNFSFHASGEVTVEITRTYPSGFIDVSLSGHLAGLRPNIIYQVWLCASGCGTNTNPEIRTDSNGSVSFSGVNFAQNQAKYPAETIQVYEKQYAGPIPSDPDYCGSKPCLSAPISLN